MNYNITFSFQYRTSVKVEANSPEEALRISNYLTNKEIVGSDTLLSDELMCGTQTGVYDEDWNILKLINAPK